MPLSSPCVVRSLVPGLGRARAGSPSSRPLRAIFSAATLLPSGQTQRPAQDHRPGPVEGIGAFTEQDLSSDGQKLSPTDGYKVEEIILPGKGHATLTDHFVDEQSHPTRQALDRILEFLQQRLR